MRVRLTDYIVKKTITSIPSASKPRSCLSNLSGRPVRSAIRLPVCWLFVYSLYTLWMKPLKRHTKVLQLFDLRQLKDNWIS